MFKSLPVFQKPPSRSWHDFSTVPVIDAVEPPFPALLEGLTTEIHTVALLTAVATSGINVLDSASARNAPADLAAYAKPDLALLFSLKSLAEQSLEPIGDGDALTAFLDAQSEAQHAFDDFAYEIRTLGADRAAIVHFHNLAGSWRHACRAAVSALTELETGLSRSLPELYRQNTRVLTALLKGAAHGFKPCVDSSGRLFIPPLPQQRRWPRQSVLQTCRLTLDGKTMTAFIRDVSAGGLGLDQVPPIIQGTRLSVEMEGGRRLSGIVVWSRDTSAGLKFAQPLLPSDPLLRG